MSKIRGVINEVHIADIHFGAMSAQKQYNILKEQFIDKIIQIPKIDIISINGDLFDHKVMSNSDVSMYASLFVADLVDICKLKNATLLLLAGTYSHDYDQLKLFYHYLNNNDIDIRIVSTLKFEDIKGAKILCIPELYGLDEEEYQKVFFHTSWYDSAFCHGTFQGSVYGDNVGNGRLLTPNDFIYCYGPAISGHVHKPGCFSGFYYYCGCPYRWKFGEEEDKGFLILSHDLDTHRHFVHFEKIQSDIYRTIFLDELISTDPKEIIDYINNLKIEQGIDFIKVKFRIPINSESKVIINNYYRTNGNTYVEFINNNDLNKEQFSISSKDKIKKYNYLLDPKISDFERFVQYVNDSEGEKIISIESLKEILSDKY
jgi:DNA repair exonuclease SbcCD nuclease subunit